MVTVDERHVQRIPTHKKPYVLSSSAVILASLVLCAVMQAAPQAPPAAQPRYPVDSATGRAIGATEMAPDAVKAALAGGRKMVIIDTRPAEAFATESLPGAINIPLAEIDKRLPEFPKDTLLAFT